MNEYSASSLFYTLALLISLARTKKRFRTFLYSNAAYWLASFVVLFTLIFLPSDHAKALGHLAGDTGRMVGAITAFLYSTKTREHASRSVYLVALSCTIILLIDLVIASL